MKNTIFKITYKVKLNNTKMIGVLRIEHNGFPELLEIENEVKKNLEKWKSSVQFLSIENIEKIVE